MLAMDGADEVSERVLAVADIGVIVRRHLFLVVDHDRERLDLVHHLDFGEGFDEALVAFVAYVVWFHREVEASEHAGLDAWDLSDVHADGCLEHGGCVMWWLMFVAVAREGCAALLSCDESEWIRIGLASDCSCLMSAAMLARSRCRLSVVLRE